MLMFTERDFAVFQNQGLEERMSAIRSEIQPKFTELDTYFAECLGEQLETNFYVHIAQHRRRTVYPPENTWSALSQNKRGYKMEGHFQLGIWPEYVFMWLSLIDNPKNEQETAQSFIDNQQLFNQLPDDFYVSSDHTKPMIQKLKEIDIKQELLRFKTVKKAEFQIGRIIDKNSNLLSEPNKACKYMLETYNLLLPLYELAMKGRGK